MRYLRITGIYVSTMSVVLSGCSHNSAPTTTPPAASAPLSPAQVQSIENDPRVSPKMKATLRSGQTPGN